MYWQEKIHRLKRKYSPAQFRDPFWRGRKIISMIMQKFFHLLSEGEHCHHLDITQIRDCTLIASCTTKTLYQEEMAKLLEGVNYWLLLINPPMGSGYQVYDCQKEALREVLYLSSGASESQFCIVDKKYRWFTFIDVNHQQNIAKIYKSGLQPTLWDQVT